MQDCRLHDVENLKEVKLLDTSVSSPGKCRSLEGHELADWHGTLIKLGYTTNSRDKQTLSLCCGKQVQFETEFGTDIDIAALILPQAYEIS